MSRNTQFATKAPVLPDITTEELILNVLISRHKLGESLWPFDICHQPALEKRGLIYTRSGVVRKTTRASLTDHALNMIKIHGDEVFAASPGAPEESEPPALSSSDIFIVEPVCATSCRHRCPECRMGLGSHLKCDPHCDHHLSALAPAASSL